MKKLLTVLVAMMFAASTGVVFAQAKGDAKGDKKDEAVNPTTAQTQVGQVNIATDPLAAVLLELAASAVKISSETSRAGLAGILGRTDQQNVHGETVQKLDVYANDLLVAAGPMVRGTKLATSTCFRATSLAVGASCKVDYQFTVLDTDGTQVAGSNSLGGASNYDRLLKNKAAAWMHPVGFPNDLKGEATATTPLIAIRS